MLKQKNLLIVAVLAVCATTLMAQDRTPQPTGPGNAVYRLEYTVIEMEGSKKTSSKTYVMIVRDDKHARMRVGNRLPVQTSGSSSSMQYQYFDLGVNIDATPNWVDASSIRLNTTYEISAVTTSDKAAIGGLPPVVRSFNDSLDTIVPLDKAVTLTSQDEPGSNTTFQVQVLAKLVK